MRSTTVVTAIMLVCLGVMAADRKVPERKDLKEGLRATIFADEKFDKKVKERHDRNIDFDFGNSAPDPSIKGHKFSIRWFGWLDVPETTDYKLSFKLDGSVSLWIDDQQIIEYGGKGNVAEIGRKVPLKEGLHFVHLDYSNANGHAGIHFRWEHGKEKRDIIPAASFFYEKGPSE